MDYLEMMEIQERIIGYKKSLKERISYVDAKGNRKLDPYYFLSAEVAAYKLLSTWEEQIKDDPEAVNDGIIELLDLIETLVNENYEDYQSYEADISMPLWFELSKGFDGEALAAFNAEVIVMASLIENMQGSEPNQTLICSMNDDDLTDPNIASYAYSIVHDYLIGQSKEKLEQFAETGFGMNSSKGELFKLHFNLFV